MRTLLKKLLEQFKKIDKKKHSYIIASIAFVGIMLWAFITAGVITGNFNRSQLSKEDEQKVDAIGLIITETKQGTKYFEIYGENGHYSNDHSVATLNNVLGNFYRDGEVAMSFQSSKGSYDEKAGTITLYDNTYIVLKDGISLNTDKLTWQGSDKDTIAEGHVVVKKNNELVSTANRGIISPGYEKFKIAGETSTKIYGKN